MGEFEHERLDVYALALDFIARAQTLSRRIPKGNGELAEQLRTAASSVGLNLAEGAGEFARSDKARFYRMARRSAAECAAILDVAQCLGAPGAACEAGREQLRRIGAMTTKLIQRVEGRTGDTVEPR